MIGSEMLGGVAPVALPLALVLTLVVGLLLGMVGGGGSIVVVPILVYVLGLPAAAAIALSLPIVGLTSLAGAAIKARRSEVHGRAALLFGLAGAVGAVLGARLTPLVPPPILLLLFAALLFALSLKMWRGGGSEEALCDNECRTGRCALVGWGVGILTGFLGVGGGFLLVPALRRFAHQTMKLATGTSLGIIAFNSVAGFAAHWGAVRGLLPLAGALTVAALLGLWAGLNFAGRVPARTLEKTFAVVALGVAAYLVFANVPAALQIIT
jgi:uncharacterized membrane protein YfcA